LALAEEPGAISALFAGRKGGTVLRLQNDTPLAECRPDETSFALTHSREEGLTDVGLRRTQDISPLNVLVECGARSSRGLCLMHNEDILAVLRRRTRRDHDAIERSVPLMSGSLSVGVYTRTIERFYGFWQPMEERLRATVGLRACGFNLLEREKTQLLALDLCALSGGDPASLSLCADLPDVAEVTSAFGCLYVIEGATLGGQIITRHLKARLNVTPENGGRFFHGYGEETGSMWKAFCSKLGAQALTLDDHGSIIEAAAATFHSLRQWLEQADTPSRRWSGDTPLGQP
jgi:heme oxygenase